MVPPQRQPSMCRKRIEIRRIENEEAWQVCFSKLHAGLFKKSSEQLTLCGAHVAAVIFSPAGKPISFGHTSVQRVLVRFLRLAIPPLVVPAGARSSAVPRTAGGEEPTPLSELNKKHRERRAQLDVQRARRERVEQRMAWRVRRTADQVLPPPLPPFGGGGEIPPPGFFGPPY